MEIVDVATYTIGSWAAGVIDDFGCQWTVSHQDLGDGPATEARTTKKPVGHGAYRRPTFWESQTWTLNGWIQAPSREAREAARSRFLALFPDGGQASLVVDDGMSQRRATVERIGKPRFSRIGNEDADWQLMLLAADPRWYETSQRTDNTTLPTSSGTGLDWATGGGLDWATGGGLDWGSVDSNGTLVVDNTDGTAPTEPLLTLHGSLSDGVVEWVETGRRIAYGQTLGAFDTLLIDNNPFSRRVLLNGTADRFSALTAAEWFSIPAGESATLRLSGSGTGSLDATWYVAHL